MLKLTKCWVKERSDEMQAVEAKQHDFLRSVKGDGLFPAKLGKHEYELNVTMNVFL